MKLMSVPAFSRPAGLPLYGKRTDSLKTAVSPLEKQLVEVVAKREGFPNPAAWVHAVIVHEIEKKHVEIITRESLERKRNNSANSGEA